MSSGGYNYKTVKEIHLKVFMQNIN